ncbi:beta-N-acetylhexosaminidase [Legionella lansingensis]|uniref:beta-N-acetylhexosaminidase n=1 Tax=Legionella lansingensis TaxID=45067 RepID=A0A0W0W0N3_9GAMM|nr:glycoside hydrolase family 3 N-terminal domain-containing protein [Legionella lansingensis]KTD25726.1 glycosyl hydrolase [Legionella lansingensis]SNV49272.1 beta-N-acetylhexosaminidase [Legionella lansingensis]
MTTLRQQIAQMLIMGFSGTTIDQSSPVRRWINQDGIGGVLLFDYDVSQQRQGKNLVDRTQIQHLTNQLQQAALSSHQQMKLPLFIAIDYEGGTVDRLKHVPGCTSTISPCEQAMLSRTDFRIEANKMAENIKSLGFNLNFAPVVDLELTKEHGIIGKLGRSFSSRPDRVSAIAKSFVDTHAKHEIVCCYKHFPGHGSALGDTHADFVDVTDTFQSAELEPYRIMAKEKSFPAMVMTAHVINRKLDPSGLPATLSKTMLSLLRQELGFDGVVISDDLQMHAIAKHYSLQDALCLTINAGADMLIFANQLGEITAGEVIDKIEELVSLKVISSERIAQAYARIVRLKQFYSCKRNFVQN